MLNLTRESASDLPLPQPGGPRLVVAATFTAEPLRPLLDGWLTLLGLNAQVVITPSHPLPGPDLLRADNDMNLVLLRPDDWAAGGREESLSLVAEALRAAVAPTLVLVCDSRVELPGLDVVYLDDLLEQYGVVDVRDAYAAREAGIPYTDEVFAAISMLAARRYAARVLPRPKVLVLDCDGTLWHGTLGEDGPDGIAVLPAHQALHQLAVRASQAGVLVCLASKNDEADVLGVFERRSDFALSRDHLVDWRINWEPKSRNLKDLARSLGLSLDTFVFVDDNPVECAAIRAELPEVATIELPADLAEREAFLAHLWPLDPGAQTREDQSRTDFYRLNARREAARRSAQTLEQFLAALELHIDCRPVSSPDVERLCQLVQRTTQFTLTSRPHSSKAIADGLAQGRLQGLVAHVADRFGDYGLVGGALYSTEADVLTVDTLVLSCRALGRGVEYALIRRLGEAAVTAGAATLCIPFESTPRNVPMRRFLERLPGRREGRQVVLDAVDAASVAPQATVGSEEEGPSVRGRAIVPADVWQHIAGLSHPRRVLARAAARDDVSGTGAAARTEQEEIVLEVWRRFFESDRIGIHDDFFAVGGNSLMATRIMSAVSARLGLHVPLSWLFEFPTVAELAAALAERQGGLSQERVETVQAGGDAASPFPLTDLQEAYLLGRSSHFELGHVGTHNYLEVDYVDLDLPRYEGAWQKLIERHPMLRTIILPDGRQQVLEAPPPWHLPILDRRGQAEVHDDLGDVMATQVLDIGCFPVFDIRATRLDDRRTRIHSSFDGITVDLWSHGILARELEALYANPDATLPPLPVTFRDFVLATVARRRSESYDRARSWWLQRVPDLPTHPQLPMACQPSDIDRPTFVRREFFLDAARWQRVKARGAQARVTDSGILLAAYAAALAAYSESRRFCLNVTLFNRPGAEFHGVVGDFTSISILDADLGAATFEEQAVTLQSQLWRDLEYREFSGVRVLREMARQRGTQGAVAPIVFTSSLALPVARGSMGGEPIFAVTQTPQVWIDCQVHERQGGLHVFWDSVEAIFPAGLVAAMFESFQALVTRLADEAEAWSLPCLPVVGMAHALEANASVARVPDALLQDGFLQQVSQRPSQAAVIAQDRTLSYQALHDESRQVAAWLRAHGAGPNRLVGILMRKGWQQVVAALGVLRAGAAYLPLDAELPAERLARLLDHAQVDVVLTQRGVSATLPPHVRTLSVDEPFETPADGADAVGRPDDLAYVIYTSGSTGQPKGVMIDHRGAVNTIVDVNRRFGVSSADCTLGLSSLSFDLSVWDVFGTLAAGGTLVIPSADRWPDPEHWADLVQRHGITVWNSVPALMELFVQPALQSGCTLKSLRLAMLSGDWIPVSLPDQIRRLAPQCAVISLGGATEASIWSNFYRIGEVSPQWASIPYGKALSNQSLWILDERMQVRPPWVPGRLYIGGLGLARGYWADAEKTAERFVTHPHTGERLYHTGDLGRYLPDGNIEFLGREDFQIKMRGFRIELGEIEAHLASHPAVRAGVVSAVGSARHIDRLVAHVVLNESADAESLRTYLAERLPHYMVPAEVVIHPRLPLSANGKVDRKALQALNPVRTVVRSERDDATGLEHEIARLFGEVLGTGEVRPTDNFFDLGGHSLLALQLSRRLEESLGVKVPLLDIFQNATVQALARLVEGGGWQSPLAQVVPLQTRGTLPPFFWVHGLNGSLFGDVVRHIGTDQPFYGLQPQGVDGRTEPLDDIHAMASLYISGMKVVQPHGPYHLGGYCFGGIIALEMAQQLRAAGDEVALLLIIDLPTSEMRPVAGLAMSEKLRNIATEGLVALSRLSRRRRLNVGLLYRKLKLNLQRVRSAFGLGITPKEDLVDALMADMDGRRGWTDTHIRIARANSRAALGYVPRRYDGRVTLLRCAEPRSPWGEDPQWGWGQIADQVTVLTVPGARHSHIIHGSHAKAVAAVLQRCMREMAGLSTPAAEQPDVLRPSRYPIGAQPAPEMS